MLSFLGGLIIVFTLATVAGLFWCARNFKFSSKESQRNIQSRRDAIELSITEINTEIADASLQTKGLQGRMHDCLGYVDKKGVITFYNLNESITNAQLVRNHLVTLFESDRPSAFLKLEEFLNSGDLDIQRPRYGRNQELSKFCFKLEIWQKETSELLEIAVQVIEEAETARELFSQKHQVS